MGLLTEAQAQAFREKGYLTVPPALSGAEVEEMREGLERVMLDRSAARPELLRNLHGGDLYHEEPDGTRVFNSAVVVQIVNIWEADEVYFRHLYHPAITQMASELIGHPHLRVWHDQIQYKPPMVGSQTGWHQDFPAWPVLSPPDLVTAWVALDDVTLANGCMRMVPGSHRWGESPGLGSGEDFAPRYDPSRIPEGAEVKVEPVEVRAGECSFHHCLTWHGSDINRSDRPRRAIAVHYMPAYTRFDPRGHHAIEHLMEVKPGEILKGTYFPDVYNQGPLTPPAFPFK
ncbi:MAG: phytanoyl-CoA dioxygenase family protein [Armatimonadetes bacterium]|nr:phytanoyl-CoA dioxygenase family protein [Armatimonadota bacterium]